MITGVADTHNVIWYIYADKNLSPAAKIFIETAISGGNQIAVSSISLIEMIFLIERSRIAAEAFSRVARRLDTPKSGLVELPVNLSIARTLSRIAPLQIPEMPDRIVAATALHLNMPVISRDSKIKLSGLTTIW